MTAAPATARAAFVDGLRSIGPVDAAAMAATAARLDRLTKPPESLGRLETLAIQLAGIRGRVVTALDNPSVVVFAGDHGITAQGVSPYPSEVTRQMVANFAAGGAAINVLADAAGAELVVVDVGVGGPPGTAAVAPAGGPRVTLVDARVAAGTRDFSQVAAMTVSETDAAIEVGRRIVRELGDRGCDLLAIGEMGIGNTTSASAIVAALTGRPAGDVTGRGTGLDEAGVARKAAVIDAALARHGLAPGADAASVSRPADAADPLAVLSAVGGLEIAALVGAIAEGAVRGIPVVLDGFITGAAALVVARVAPATSARLIASHRSAERGHRIVLEELGLEPLLDLDLRLGEGSGAALAIPLIRSSLRLFAEMATFGDAGVSDRT